MAVEIVMPRLGWTMEEGTLVEWLKRPGEAVQADEVLFTVETDKALNEVESFDAGRLHIPEGAPAPGATVAVGTVLGYLLAEGEEPPSPSAPASPAAGSEAGAPAAAASSGGVPPGAASPPASEAAPPAPTPAGRAPPPNASTPPTSGAAPTPLGIASPGATSPPTPEAPAISPRARRLAQQVGIDWRKVRGTGRTGRITEDDVRAAAADQAEGGGLAE